mgnify:CR=1 FL=1
MTDHVKALNDLRPKIKALAEKPSLTADEAGDLSKLLGEAKTLQMQIEAAAYGKADEPPAQQADPNADIVSKTTDAVLKALEAMPGFERAGFGTNLGGTNDPKSKSLGDFLLAIKRQDVKRLTQVYGSSKTMEEDSGTAGGYLVPEEYRTDLLKVSAMSSQVVPMVTRIPVRTDAGSWPALDQFTAPTAGVGETAFAGGAALDVSAESGTLAVNNDPVLTDIQWRVHKVGNIVKVSNELRDDAPAIEALLRTLFGVAIAAKEEYFILRGTGTGMPLGVLNSPCAVASTTVADNVFAYADALAMISRFHAYVRPGRWVMHPGVYPDIGVWEIGTNGAGVPSFADLGYGAPIFSEHMPQANGDDVILGDFGAYLFFDRQGLTIDYSEHAYFGTDQVGWRFKERLDGMPWLKGAITLADPTGSYTVSPFVYHDD